MIERQVGQTLQLSDVSPGSVTPVAIIDDDLSIRRGLGRLLASFGIAFEAFVSAEEFLEASPVAGCLILDVQLPGMSGIELYEHMVRAGDPPPVVFISAHETPRVLEAIERLGALAFFRKPFDTTLLVRTVEEALGSATSR